jgi:uncharacterized protein (DUF1330 family)
LSSLNIGTSSMFVSASERMMEGKMTAYLIAEVAIKDRERYVNEFVPIVAQAHQDMGAKLLARTDDAATLSGMPPGGRMVLVQFPDTDTARRWWTSVAMKKAQDMRDVLRINSLVVVEGITT